MVEDVEGTLLAAVHANPEDEQARAVYADWLEGRGDPRGEYLRLELQRVTIPRRLAELVAGIEPDWLRMVHGKFRISITGHGDNVIQAIKSVRELTGLGLAAAKELVVSATEATPGVLADEVELDRAHEIVKHCDGNVGLRVEPPLPALTSVKLRSRRYRLLLVGVRDPQQLTDVLYDDVIDLETEEEARAIVAQIAAGTPYEVGRELLAHDAAASAAAYGDFALVRTERML